LCWANPCVVAAAERGRRPLGHDATGGHYGDPVGERLRLVHVVSGEQYRRAGVAQVANVLPRASAGARVESGRRLVEEQQARVADHAERQAQPPLLATRQVLDELPLLAGQPDQLDDLVHVARSEVVAGVARDGLAHGEVRLDRDILQHQADPLAQQPGGCALARIQAEHLDPARVTAPERSRPPPARPA
jgi:hypothetical protein